MCAITVVPGMGTTQGFCASSQASETCAGVACFRPAQPFNSSTSVRLCGRFSGENRDSTPRMSPGANRVFASFDEGYGPEAPHGCSQQLIDSCQGTLM